MIFDHNFNFSPKFRFFTKIPTFGHNLNFWRKLKFLNKIEILWRKLKFLNKIEIFLKTIEFFEENWNFWTKLEFLNKIEIFDQNWLFLEFREIYLFGETDCHSPSWSGSLEVCFWREYSACNWKANCSSCKIRRFSIISGVSNWDSSIFQIFTSPKSSKSSHKIDSWTPEKYVSLKKSSLKFIFFCYFLSKF